MQEVTAHEMLVALRHVGADRRGRSLSRWQQTLKADERHLHEMGQSLQKEHSKTEKRSPIWRKERKIRRFRRQKTPLSP